MPNWLTCKLTGRHEYTVWCEDGTMFLRCSNCGRRSQGWQVGGKAQEGERPPDRPAGRTPIARLSTVRQD